MSDISTIWDTALGVGDWELVGADLASGKDLVSATFISLFTDRVADPGDTIPDGTSDPRGWWGDLDQDYPIGSRLWLLDRAKQTPENLRNAHDYVAEALQWMIDDEIVAHWDILCEWIGPGRLGIQAEAHQGSGASSKMKFIWAWKGI